jgi:hypothetical protein
MAPHQLYQQSGRLRVRMEDGTEAAAGNAVTSHYFRKRPLTLMEQAGLSDVQLPTISGRRNPR